MERRRLGEREGGGTGGVKERGTFFAVPTTQATRVAAFKATFWCSLRLEFYDNFRATGLK